MDKTQFVKDFGELFNQGCNYSPASAYHTFTDTEYAQFMESVWNFFSTTHLETSTIDFTSPPFFYAMQRAVRKYSSIQDQLSVLGQYFKEEVEKGRLAQKKKP